MYTSLMLRLCVCYGDHGGWGGVGSIAQKAWHNVSAGCFAVVLKIRGPKTQQVFSVR